MEKSLINSVDKINTLRDKATTAFLDLISFPNQSLDQLFEVQPALKIISLGGVLHPEQPLLHLIDLQRHILWTWTCILSIQESYNSGSYQARSFVL